MPFNTIITAKINQRKTTDPIMPNQWNSCWIDNTCALFQMYRNQRNIIFSFFMNERKQIHIWLNLIRQKILDWLICKNVINHFVVNTRNDLGSFSSNLKDLVFSYLAAFDTLYPALNIFLCEWFLAWDIYRCFMFYFL